MRVDGKDFRKLDDDIRRRLEERGIDIEQSYALFQAEIRVKPPPLLVSHLTHDDHARWKQQPETMRPTRERMSEADKIRFKGITISFGHRQPWKLKKKGKQARITDAELRELYDLYCQEGLSLRELVADRWQRWGYSNPAVAFANLRVLFKNRNLPLRTKSEAMTAKWRRRQQQEAA